MHTRTFYQATSKFVSALMLAMLLLAAMPVSPAYAADTGWVDPQSNAATSGGDWNGFETNPTGAYANGGGYAYNSNGDGDRHLYYGYNLSSIPAGAIIQGIEVRLDWWLDSTSGYNQGMNVQLSWDGGSSWTNADYTTGEPTSETTTILGGSADTWGHTWDTSVAVNELSSSNFRIRVECTSSDWRRDFSLDWIPVRITVHV